MRRSACNFVLLVWMGLLFTQAAAQTLTHPPGDFAEIRGRKIWYELDGEGDPLILIAGGPGFSHAYFHPFLSAIGKTNRVIYFDAYGTGKSGRATSAKEYSLAADVDDLEGLRKALRLDKVNVLGHSYGGFVAQLYAAKYPNSVRRLILANTYPNGALTQSLQDNLNAQIRDQMPELWSRIKQVRAKGFTSSSKEHQEAYSFPPTFSYFFNPENARHLPTAESNLYNPDLWYAMGGSDADFVVKGAISRFDARAKLRKLKIPILVLAGRYDRMVPPRVMRRYKTLVPQAQFVMLEKSGHFPFIEENQVTIEVIRTFLAR